MKFTTQAEIDDHIRQLVYDERKRHSDRIVEIGVINRQLTVQRQQREHDDEQERKMIERRANQPKQ